MAAPDPPARMYSAPAAPHAGYSLHPVVRGQAAAGTSSCSAAEAPAQFQAALAMFRLTPEPPHVTRTLDTAPCRLSVVLYFVLGAIGVQGVLSGGVAYGALSATTQDVVVAVFVTVGMAAIGAADMACQGSMRRDVGWLMFMQMLVLFIPTAAVTLSTLSQRYLVSDPNASLVVFLFGMRLVHNALEPLAKFATAWRAHTPLTCVWRTFEECFACFYFLHAASWVAFGRMLMVKALFQLAVSIDPRSVQRWRGYTVETGHSLADDVTRVVQTFAQNCMQQLAAPVLVTATLLADLALPGPSVTALITPVATPLLLARFAIVLAATVGVMVVAAPWLELLGRHSTEKRVHRWPVFSHVAREYLGHHAWLFAVVTLRVYSQVLFRAVQVGSGTRLPAE